MKISDLETMIKCIPNDYKNLELIGGIPTNLSNLCNIYLIKHSDNKCSLSHKSSFGPDYLTQNDSWTQIIRLQQRVDY